MIGSLRGELTVKELRHDNIAVLVVDVNGVGYELLCDARLYRELPQPGSSVALSVHTHVREGSFTLYGFATRGDRYIFEELLTAHGVGPSLALAILGSLGVNDLVAAVAANDQRALTQVPGVGAKTAQRLLLELGQRLELFASTTEVSAGSLPGVREQRAEVSEALGALGYGSNEIREVLAGLPELEGVDQMLRHALAALAPGR